MTNAAAEGRSDERLAEAGVLRSTAHLSKCEKADTVSDKTVTLTYQFEASPESVFDAWLDPDLLASWMFDPSTLDQKADEIDIDANVGGRFRFDIHRGGQPFTYTGTFREIARPTRLVFTWTEVGTDELSIVTVGIQPSEGGSLLTLRQVFETATLEQLERVEALWLSEFTSLNRVLH